MLHGTINEQEKCLGVKYYISEQMNIYHMFSYNSLAFGAFILELIDIAYNKLLDICYRCYK